MTYKIKKKIAKEILNKHPRKSDEPLEKILELPLSTVKKFKDLLEEEGFLMDVMDKKNPVKKDKIDNIKEKIKNIEIPEEVEEKYREKNEEENGLELKKFAEYFKDNDTSKKEARHYTAQHLAQNSNFKTLKQTDQIWHFSNPVYKPEGEKKIRNTLQKNIGPVITTHDIREIKNKVKSFTQTEREEKEEKTVVAVKNGHLDVKNQELQTPDPERFVVNEIPVNYKPEADCPKFKEYLKGAMPDKEDRKRIQELLGTALVKEKMHKKGCILVGPTDAGKTTLIKIIKNVLGRENTASQAPKALADTRWGKIKLQNILLNGTDEVEEKQIYGLAVLKKIMDGNPISAEKKGQDPIEFKPTCEHIFAANQTPTASRKDDAFWNRWIVPTMPNSVPEEEQDDTLPARIVEEEKQGILNWMVKGLQDFFDNGRKFTYPQHWKDSRDKWLNWGNSIQRFIQNRLTHEEGNKITSKRLYEEYKDYVQNKTDLDMEGRKNFTQEIQKLSYSIYSESLRFNGKQRRGFKNVGVTGKRNRILSIVESHDEGEGVTYQKVIEASSLDQSKVEGILEDLKEDGELYENKPGHVKRL